MEEEIVSKTIIKNIGKIITGDIDNPVLAADTIVIEDKLIVAIGGSELLTELEAATVIDANGATVTPGLFDTHVHVSGGDFAPCLRPVDELLAAYPPLPNQYFAVYPTRTHVSAALRAFLETATRGIVR